MSSLLNSHLRARAKSAPRTETFKDQYKVAVHKLMLSVIAVVILDIVACTSWLGTWFVEAHSARILATNVATWHPIFSIYSLLVTMVFKRIERMQFVSSKMRVAAPKKEQLVKTVDQNVSTTKEIELKAEQDQNLSKTEIIK